MGKTWGLAAKGMALHTLGSESPPAEPGGLRSPGRGGARSAHFPGRSKDRAAGSAPGSGEGGGAGATAAQLFPRGGGGP